MALRPAADRRQAQGRSLTVAQEPEGVTVPADGAYINTGLVVPHRKRPGRALLPGEEEGDAEHRRVRARLKRP
ncbi:hypothetical protein GCM10010446_19920 [Streptomyces enissocaesilis]|uniref:Transposase n=1 Tax=Streptomyces enissocaesilis TaxID=332589 RepID=A0ABN3X1W6_9ACTN